MTALVRERRPARNRTPVALAIVALALAGLAWWRGGPGLALAGLVQGGKTRRFGSMDCFFIQ